MRTPGFRRIVPHGSLSFVVLATLVVALAGGCAQTSGSAPSLPPLASTGTQASAAPTNVLPNGRVITPAGSTSGPVGGMPLNIVLSPDKKFAITTSSSYVTNLCSVRVSDGTIISTINVPTCVQTAPDAHAFNYGLYYGLVFDPHPTPQNGYTLYAAQGAWGTVAVFTLGADGTLTPQAPTPTQQPRTIPAAPANPPVDQPAGLALDARGFLYITNNLPGVAPANPGYSGPSTLSIYKTDGTATGSYTFQNATSTHSYPLAVTVKSDGSRTYVASERDGKVYVLDTVDPTAPVLAATLVVGDHPDALLLNQAQTRLYVANAGSDTISVVNTVSNQVLSTVLLRPSNVSHLPGVSPTGLALSPDETTLYASLGDYNAVGVIDTASGQLRGYIPVGWYPTAVAATDTCLLVTNGWGTSAMNPNPQFSYLQPGTTISPGPGFVLTSVLGNVSRINLAQAVPALAASTVQVVQNTQNTPAAGNPAGDALAQLGVQSGKIKHVIYVIKENRGYDAVMSDLPKGNRDRSLLLFGEDVTPNQHALAQRFILLDNFYNNGPVSNEGWQWCTQSQANEYTIRNVPYLARITGGATKPNGGAFGLQDCNYITGGYPAMDCDGVALPNGPAAPIPAVAAAPGGFIWDKVFNAHLTYRNYGFLLSIGVPAPAQGRPAGATWPWVIPDNYPTVTNLREPGHMTAPLGAFPLPPTQPACGLSDYDFRQFDFGYADSDAWWKHGLTAAQCGLWTVPAVGPPTPGYYTHNALQPQLAQRSRFSEWNREFQHMTAGNVDNVPTFMMVRFMRDHTVALTPELGSPSAMVADNDYAVGQLVDAVSHSCIWNSTAIFIIEDDAQEDGDHVDTRRSYIQVVSPWIKRGTLDSRFYDTNSVLKSMELLMGLTPMSQYDNFANPFLDCWDTAPNNNAPYDAILPAKRIIQELNPRVSSYKPNDPRRRLAILSARMNFRVEDVAPRDLVRDAIWMSVKGPHVKMPKLRKNQLECLDRLKPQRSGDGDDD